MAHAGENGVAGVQQRIGRRDGGRGAVGTFEGDNTHLMIALEFRDADRFGVVAAGKIQREPEYLEFTERVDVGTVA